MTCTRRLWIGAATIVMNLLLATVSTQVQSPGPTSAPPLVIASMTGRDLFDHYCSICHGRDGKGGGSATALLKAPPPDLTTISRRNGGLFPRATVQALISGELESRGTAHGTKEMPLWGSVFKGLDPSDTRNAIRLANIVRFLDSIQVE
jgi:mono/diheme cytochrome c family protein